MTYAPACRRRGVALLVVLWVLVIVTVICLSLAGAAQAQLGRAREVAALLRGDQAAASAAAVARSVLAEDATAADHLAEPWSAGGTTIFTHRLNGGRLTLLAWWPEQGVRLGLRDEAACLNANTATAQMLARLPGLNAALAAELVAQRGELTPAPPPAGDDALAVSGGPSGPIRHHGQLAALLSAAHGGTPSRAAEPPWANPHRLDPEVAQALAYLTVHSQVPNTDARGQRRVNLNTASAPEIGGAFGGRLDQERLEALITARSLQPFASIGDVLTREMYVLGPFGKPRLVRITPEELAVAADHLTTTDATVLSGLVNVNTAPAEVLACLPGLTAAAAEALVAARARLTPRQAQSIGWLLDVISVDQFVESCRYVTTRSDQFRADWAYWDDQSAGGTYGFMVLDRSQGRPMVVDSGRYRGPRTDPQTWRP